MEMRTRGSVMSSFPLGWLLRIGHQPELSQGLQPAAGIGREVKVFESEVCSVPAPAASGRSLLYPGKGKLVTVFQC